jgi:hypothetical protein
MTNKKKSIFQLFCIFVIELLEICIMNNTSIIISVIVAGTGLTVAIITTIKGFRDVKKSTEQKILKRKERHLKTLDMAK